MQLMAANALFGIAKQVQRLKELMKRYAAMLENRANLHGELFAAIAALVEAKAHALLDVRFDVADATRTTAMGADRTCWPQRCLQEGERRFLIMKMVLTENRDSHDRVSSNSCSKCRLGLQDT